MDAYLYLSMILLPGQTIHYIILSERPPEDRLPISAFYTVYMDNSKVILITGGQRSGKSVLSERLALSYSDSPVYLATAEAYDEEFKDRVRLHQERRGPQWHTIEERVDPGSLGLTGKTVLLDCVTMWATNCFFLFKEDIGKSLSYLKENFDRMVSRSGTYIFVSNEIGAGGISANKMQRAFTDLQGWFNQYIAARADEVYLTVAGIPVRIK